MTKVPLGREVITILKVEETRKLKNPLEQLNMVDCMLLISAFVQNRLQKHKFKVTLAIQ